MHKRAVAIATYGALDIFDLGEDVEVEAVCLASGAVSSVHEITEGQNEAQHMHDSLFTLQRLEQGARGAVSLVCFCGVFCII